MSTKNALAIGLSLFLPTTSFFIGHNTIEVKASFVSSKSPFTCVFLSSGELEDVPYVIANSKHYDATDNIKLSGEENNDQNNENKQIIPSIDTPGLSKLSKEFYKMMHEFTLFNHWDIVTVENPRYRVLYEGIAAGARDPAVLQAFRVIYEDLVPIRYGGRMMYRHLKDVMKKSIEKRNKEEERVVSTTGLSLDAINDGRKAFMAIVEEDGEGQLTMTQLIDSGIVSMVIELLDYESFDDFITKLETDDDGKLNFEMFMISLQKCVQIGTCSSTSDVSCNLTEVLSEIVERMGPIEESRKGTSVSERKLKYSNRYDDMVISFEEWEDLIPTGDGRMLDVLRGCFAGAKNKPVVTGLKVVYMDYSALRVGGDLVFRIMKKLVPSKKA